MNELVKFKSLANELDSTGFTELIGEVISIDDKYRELIINAISKRLKDEQHHDDLHILTNKVSNILQNSHLNKEIDHNDIFHKISNKSMMKCVSYLGLSSIDYINFSRINRRMYFIAYSFNKFKTEYSFYNKIPVRTKGDNPTFVRNKKSSRYITKKGVSNCKWIIRDIYEYKNVPKPQIHIDRPRKIDIRRICQFQNTQSDIYMDQDTADNITNYLIKYSNKEMYPPIFIPTMAKRINYIDLSAHYSNSKCLVFLVIDCKEYDLFYNKYHKHSNFFFITHEEESIVLIRQCIKFFVTSNVWKNIDFYYEIDDDIKKLAYNEKGEISFDDCLFLLYAYIQLFGEQAIILSVSPLRRYWKKSNRKRMFSASTKCEKFKIVRICKEFKNVNYASEEMLMISKSGWITMKQQLDDKNLEKKRKINIQKKLRQGEDFGLCEQLAVPTKIIEYLGKQYEAIFKTKCFIFSHIGIVQEYNVESGCKTLK